MNHSVNGEDPSIPSIDNKSSNPDGNEYLSPYRKYFEHAPDGVFVADSEGNYLEVNRAACRITGYSAEELCRMKVIDLIPSDDHELAAAHFQRCISEGEAVGDIHFVNRAGEKRLWTVKAVKISETRLIGFVQDITDQASAVSALKESEQRLVYALRATNDGLWDWDLVTNQAFFNAAYYTMLGYEVDEFPANYENWRIRVHPDDLQESERQIQHAIQTDTPYLFEFRMHRKDGNWQWIRNRGRTVEYDGQGKPIRMVGTHTDIQHEKEMQENIQQSEKQFMFLLENAADVFWIYNLTTDQWVYLSPNRERLRGYTIEEAMQQKMKDIVTEESAQYIFQKIAERMPIFKQDPLNSESYTDEIEQTHKNGSTIWTEIISRYLYNEKGEVLMLGVTRNINERKEATRQLELSRQRLLRAERVSRSGNWEFHLNSRMLYASDGAVEIYGLPQNDMLISEVQKIPLPEYRHRLDEALRALVEDGTPYQVEFKILNQKNGQIVDIHSEAEYDAEKNMVFGVIQDITEQKQAEDALKSIEWMVRPQSAEQKKGSPKPDPASYGDLSSLNRSRLILDSVGPVVLNDISGDYLDLLKSSSAIYERNGDYALGIFSSGWCEFMDKSSRNLCEGCSNQEALQSGKWLCHESCWMDASKPAIERGEAVDIECKGGIRIYAIPVWVNGEVQGAINFGYGDPPRDEPTLAVLAERYQVPINELRKKALAYESRPAFIVELAKERLEATARLIGALMERKLAADEILNLNTDLEERVKVRTHELETSNRELEAFAYSVSHDLRAPLRAIDGYSSMLRDGFADQLDENGRRYLDLVRDKAQHMDLLITQLLALSRVNQAKMQMVSMDMAQVVKEVWYLGTSDAIQAQFQFILHPLPQACGDAGLLRQVWRNLIDNAVKYTRPKEVRVIEIDGWQDGNYSMYRIRDTGVGFDSRFVDKLFGVFQRLHSESEFEGTGIGLAIVERIIRRHGGKIHAEGVVNEGAVFIFSIPRV